MIEAIFKKYFWIVTGLTAVVLALLTALTVNAWLAGQIDAAVPLIGASSATSDVPKDSLAEIREKDGSLAMSLVEERMYNADPPEDKSLSLGDGSDPESINKTDDGNPNGDEDTIPESDLNIELLGTLVAEDPNSSLATLRNDGETKLLRVGMQVDEEVQLHTIARTYVLVNHNDKIEQVKLWSEKKAAALPSSRRGPRGRRGARDRYKKDNKRSRKPPRGIPSRSRKPKKDWSKGVAKVGDWEYKIDRGMLDESLEDMTGLTSGAKVVPNIVGGKYRGFRLVGVRPNSMYRAIGFQSGDTIQRINGVDIDNPAKALSLFEQLRSSSRITIDLKRRGLARTLHYGIQ